MTILKKITLFIALNLFVVCLQAEQNIIIVKGNISTNYIISDTVKVEITENGNSKFVSYRIKNQKIRIKSKKFNWDKNLTAYATIYGNTLSNIRVTNGAILRTNEAILNDTANISVSRGGDLRVHSDNKKIIAKVKTKGFVELTGKTDNLFLKVTTDGLFRGNNAEIKKANIKLSIRGTAVLATKTTGKIGMCGELIIYDEQNIGQIKKSKRGKITIIEDFH